MEVDAPKSQNLAKIMADTQAQCDELAQKNQEELDKYWTQQIEESTTVLTTQSAELRAADMSPVLGESSNLESMSNLKANLENSLRELEAYYTCILSSSTGSCCTW
ncbi:Keratin, type I cytoskeletal 18, partial [Saguinus oedipus]